MRVFLVFLVIIPLTFSGCKKCVQCEIRLKQSQQVIGFIDDFCGNDKKIKEEEERLRADYTCIECSVSTFNANSGVLCGDRTYTDSIRSDWQAGAFDAGTTANCIFYRDTANVSCVLKP